MIISIRGNLQQLAAYGLGLQLMSTNGYEMLVDWEQYGSAWASLFEFTICRGPQIIDKQACSNVLKGTYIVTL